MIAPLAMLTVLGLGVLNRAGRLQKVFVIVVLGFLALDLYHANRGFLSPGIGFCLTVSVLLPFVICLAVLGVKESAWRAWGVVSLSLILITLSGPALAALVGYRDRTRWEHYRTQLDLDYFPRGFVPAWEYIDRQAGGRTIAMTTGFLWPGHNWFLYPLFGSRLQNRVVYAGVKRRGDCPTHLDSGMLREGGDPAVWLDNLRALNVDWVVVQAPIPQELGWITANSSQFRLLFSDANVAVLDFVPPQLSCKTCP